VVAQAALLEVTVDIPIDEAKWHRIIDPAYLDLPKGHFAEYCQSGGEMIVRITGPNAHVTGNAVYLETAIAYALDWFYEVGGEL
jgi:hypothetical protein